MTISRQRLTTIFAATALTLSALVAPTVAHAAAPVDVPSTMDSHAEGMALAQSIENELGMAKSTSSPLIVSFTPRIADASVTPPSTTLRASFPLPAGCSATAEQLVVDCEWGELALTPTALRGDGTPVSFSSAIVGTKIEVTATAGSADSGSYLFTVYASRTSDKATARRAAESLPFTLSLAAELSDPATRKSLVEEQWASAPKPALRATDATTSAALPYISVPSNYVYCSTHTTAACKPATLHDYCSYSANGFRAANFRGPCARHDLAIDGIRKESISLASKKSKRTKSDVIFLAHLILNCGHANPNNETERTACVVVANGYKAAVSLATANWNGK